MAKGIVDAGEIDRVLQTATHHRFLVIGRGGISPLRQMGSRLVASRAVRVKDDLGAPRRRPSMPRIVATEYARDRSILSRPASTEEATRGEARAMIMAQLRPPSAAY